MTVCWGPQAPVGVISVLDQCGTLRLFLKSIRLRRALSPLVVRRKYKHGGGTEVLDLVWLRLEPSHGPRRLLLPL